MAAMLFVNNPGDWGHLFPPFDHAAWHGWTPTDLIFPFFLFIVGTAGVFSLAKRSAAGATRAELARHAVTRGLVIVLVGWGMAAFPFTPERLLNLRIPGVLPRIGVVYLLGTCLVLAFPKRSAASLAAAVALLLASHTFLLTGLGWDLTREGNLARAVDLALLKGHVWKRDWDPEGIVSTLTALATMLTGTLAGLWLKSARPPARKAAGLLFWGAAAAVLGQLWGTRLPVNKNLWTGSYVVLTSGLAAVALGLCLLLLDVRKAGRFGFFLTFGRNPLMAFVLSGLLAKTLGLVRWAGPDGKVVTLHRFLYRTGFAWIPDPALASHAFALLTVLFWWAVLKGFERKGWYWRV